MFNKILFRAAYVIEGENMFAQNSVQDNVQRYNGRRFRNELDLFLKTAIDRSPTLSSNQEFCENFSKLLSILSKGEEYYKVINSDDYSVEKLHVIQSQTAGFLIPKNIKDIAKINSEEIKT